MLGKNIISGDDYREAMSRFAGAVHIATTDGPAGRRGATVIASCSVSDNPPIVLVCLNRQNPRNDVFSGNGCFALNTLASGQRFVAEVFSGQAGLPHEERFDVGNWRTLASGAPVLSGALAIFDCEIIEAREMATHYVLFGRVAGLIVGDSQPPLLYHNRGYRVLADDRS